MCFTPCFEAIQVVPQKKHTIANANNAFALVPFFRIVIGLNTDSLLMVALVTEIGFEKSNGNKNFG